MAPPALIPHRPAPRPSGFPRAIPLLGREADVARALALVERRVPLLSVLGPPGVGKTTFVSHLVTRVGAGAWFCDVASARSASELALAVSSRLGHTTDRPEQVAALLAELPAPLVVLDNAEQLGGALTTLAAWMDAAPASTFWVTSRERLALPGESLVELAPLALPADDDDHDAPSVALFLRTAEAAGGRGLHERAAIADIVRTLDGLPLAIELAAARTRLMPPVELAARLRSGGDVLGEAARAPERHRSLSRAVAWSWALLDRDERRALACLSQLSGPFDVALAERMLGHAGLGPSALSAIASLRDKSLIHAASEPLLGVYDAVRRFARARLDDEASPDASTPDAWPAAAKRAFVRALAEAALAFTRSRLLLGPLHGVAPPTDVTRLAPDLVAAWALAHVPDERAALAAALTLAGQRAHEATSPEQGTLSPNTRALAQITAMRTGTLVEARASAAALDADGALPASLRAAAWLHLGLVERLAGCTREARVAHERAASLLETLAAGDDGTLDRGERLRSVNVACMGRIEGDLGHFDRARTLDHQASAACEALGEPWLAALGPANLAQIAIEEGDFARAEALLTPAVERFRQAREPLYRAVYAAVTAGMYFEWGRLDLARRWYGTLDARDTAVLPAVLGAHVAGMRAMLDAETGDVPAALDHLEQARRCASQSFGALGALQAELASVAVALVVGRASPTVVARARTLVDRSTDDGARIDAHTDARVTRRLLARVLHRTGARTRLEIAPGAASFAVDGGPAVALETRGALRRIVLALADAHESGRTLDADAVFAAGWPGQKIRPDSRSMRVRGAILMLRKMGLRDVLVTNEAGYRFAEGAVVER